jgi:hypothetical protein
MDWEEVQTRLAQSLSKRSDVLRYRLGMRTDLVPLPENSAKGNFFFANGEAPQRAELVRLHMPEQAESIIHEANEICAHRFRLLGYEHLDYGPEIDWHLDSVHGKRAPLDPWFQIPFLEFAAVGDHKVTWELNRHQHLVTLAKAWLLTNDDKYVRDLAAQWRSWVKANPYPIGINWGSTLEVAFRSLSWIWVDQLLAESPEYSKMRRDLLPALEFHGRYIERYLSTYFSPNTHLLGEALAMFFLGVLYPQMPHSRRWKEKGWQVLTSEAGRQVRPDGVYFEQSLYYHVYALDFFLHARVLAAANGITIPAAYDETLGKMLNVLAALAQAGVAEGFGDDDGGRLFDSSRNETEHMTDPLALGAVVYVRDSVRGDHRDYDRAYDRGYDHDDLTAAQLTEESIWLFGEAAIARLAPVATARSTSGATPSHLRSTSFPDGGIYVLADSEPYSQVMMVDCGPQGTGRCGHGHADALSLRFTMSGERWLVDSGSGVYISSDPADRNVFRGTAAHNTIRVDGVDQAIPGEPFSWSQIPTSQMERWVAGRTFTYFSGSHNGYARLSDAVIHRRSVVRVNGCSVKGAASSGIWLVRDVLLGDAVHEMELFWHFANDVVLDKRGATEVVASRPAADNRRQPRLRMISPEQSAWQTDVTSGRPSPAYGGYENARIVRSHANIKLPAETATALIAESSATTATLHTHVIHVPNAAAQVYELRIEDALHTFVFGEGKQTWIFGQWSSDAELLYSRTENNKLAQLIIVGGGSVEWQGRALLQSAEKLEHFEWRKEDDTLHAEPPSISATSFLDELLTGAASISSATHGDDANSNSYAEKH